MMEVMWRYQRLNEIDRRRILRAMDKMLEDYTPAQPANSYVGGQDSRGGVVVLPPIRGIPPKP